MSPVRAPAPIALGRADIPRTGDWIEWREIHRHLFGNVYPWAGRPRTVRMGKNDKEFLRPADFTRFIPEILHRGQTLDWTALDHPEFTDAVARLFMDLNWAHPFREGNGRCTQLFIDRLTSPAPWQLDFTRISRDDWDLACDSSRPATYQPPVHPNLLLDAIAAITIARNTTHGHDQHAPAHANAEAVVPPAEHTTSHNLHARAGLPIAAAINAAVRDDVAQARGTDPAADQRSDTIRHAPASEADASL
ncbi:Fic family protein [Nocardia farcinica]|nr:Fic family protein [Nocardia farcinica]